MTVRPAACALLLLLAGSGRAVGAEEQQGIRVELRVHGAGAVTVPVGLVASRGEDELIRSRATAPGSVVLDVQPPFRLDAEAEGFWSRPLAAEEPLAEALEIHLWPRNSVRALLRVPRGHALPAAVSLRLRQDGDRKGGLLTDVTILCPVDDEGRLECALPAVDDLDVRLRAPGFASRFFWDLDLASATPHDLGSVVLRPGASVIGRVEVPAGFDLAKVRAVLLPAENAAHALPTGGSGGDRGLLAEASPDARGHIALEGLPAGSYRLEVRHPALAPYVMPLVRVVDGGQTELAETVVLVEPIPLRLVFDPPFDPHGGDWRARIYRRAGPATRWRVGGGDDLVAVAGLLEVSAGPGAYEVEVFDSRGVRLASEEIDAAAGGEPHLLRIRPVFVAGLVTLGDEPVLARVTFRGPVTVAMDADVDGRFGGYLPRPGEWDVAVHSFEPPIDRRDRSITIEIEESQERAFLHLRLPDTTLTGTVVDEEGRSVAGAEVTVTDPLLTSSEVTVETDDDGAFEVRGLDEGEVQAQAVVPGEEASSQPVTARLQEGEVARVRLVLRAHGRLRGRIVGADGDALPGVWLEAQPFGGSGVLDAPSARPRATDPAGRFDLSFPRSTAIVHLSVLAPGRPLTQAVVELGDVGDLVVGRSSGTLTVDLPGPLTEVVSSDPTQPRPGLVDRNGIKLPLTILAQWAGLDGRSWGADDTRLTVPLLAPGRYALCWLSPADWLLRGAAGTGCVTGELGAGGELTLRLPPPPGG